MWKSPEKLPVHTLTFHGGKGANACGWKSLSLWSSVNGCPRKLGHPQKQPPLLFKPLAPLKPYCLRLNQRRLLPGPLKVGLCPRHKIPCGRQRLERGAPKPGTTKDHQ